MYIIQRSFQSKKGEHFNMGEKIEDGRYFNLDAEDKRFLEKEIERVVELTPEASTVVPGTNERSFLPPQMPAMAPSLSQEKGNDADAKSMPGMEFEAKEERMENEKLKEAFMGFSNKLIDLTTAFIRKTTSDILAGESFKIDTSSNNS